MILMLAEEWKQGKAIYRSLAHVCPTSVMVERLFSDAKHIMTDIRRHMDPSTLDMLLILKHNKDLWNAKTIDDILSRDELISSSTRKHANSDNGDSESIA